MASLNREERADLAAAGSIPEAVFTPSGEFWTIGYRDRTFLIKASKGLGYIQ